MDGEAATMKQDSLINAGICLFMILLSAAGLVYGFMSQLILAPDAWFSLDGILLTLICLSVGGLFSAMLAFQGYKEGWIKLPGKKTPAANKDAANVPETK